MYSRRCQEKSSSRNLNRKRLEVDSGAEAFEILLEFLHVLINFVLNLGYAINLVFLNGGQRRTFLNSPTQTDDRE
jgi:hypothetical protein